MNYRFTICTMWKHFEDIGSINRSLGTGRPCCRNGSVSNEQPRQYGWRVDLLSQNMA